jgi:lipoprotein-anchoring transpeptidase ErfK/SrfK
VAILLRAPQSHADFFFWRSKPAPETQPPISPANPSTKKQSTTSSEKPKTPQKTSRPAPTKPSLRSLPEEDRNRNVQLQVFLDRNLFSPKSIDGHSGSSTLKALNAYLAANEQSPVSDEKQFTLPEHSPRHSTFTLETKHLQFISTQGNTRHSIPYSSITEFICERFHCSEELLSTLNPTRKLNSIVPGDEITVPDVEPFELETIQPTAATPENEALRDREIHVDLANRSLKVTHQSKTLAAFPIAIGSPGLPTPKGKWRITGICLLPTYRWDQGVLNRGVRTNNFKMMPPGPNNPVGVVWCGLNKLGLGIHGTNQPDSIGTASSHGCIRLANWDAIRLTALVNSGTPVFTE